MVLALGLLSSQAGHLLAYWTRFGDRAWSIQASGAHLYFPLVAKTAVGGVAAILIAGLLVVGLARVVAGRRLDSDTSVSYLRLLALVFTVQMACYAAQESIEAGLGVAPATTAAGIVLWGTLGQLPVAAISALALRWLAARVEPALRQMVGVLGRVRAISAGSTVFALLLPFEPHPVPVGHSPSCSPGRAPPSASI